MSEKLSLTVVTPERLAFDEMVDDVAVPGSDGELGILPHHAFMLSQLRTGVLSYHQNGEKKVMAISGGYVQVTPERVTVLATEAVKPEEIDVERVRMARDYAMRELKSGQLEIDFIRAQAKLEKTVVQLRIATKGREGSLD